MGAFGVGPAGVSTITPVPRHTYTKVGVITVADGATGFAAFGIPKYAVPIGVYAICNGANATQTISAGYTNGGSELIDAYAPNDTGYDAVGAAAGTGVGAQVTSDKIVFLKASATLTSPVIVKVEYYIPPQGLAL